MKSGEEIVSVAVARLWRERTLFKDHLPNQMVLNNYDISLTFSIRNHHY
jgi:hypothetical protein